MKLILPAWLVLAVATAGRGQITYLSDTRSISAKAVITTPQGLTANHPVTAGPIGTFTVTSYPAIFPPGIILDDERDYAASTSTAATYDATAGAMFYRRFVANRYGGEAYAWQQSTLAPDRITAAGGIRDVNADMDFATPIRAVATSLFDVSFRLDQPATIDLNLDAREIPAPGATCIEVNPCRYFPHRGELTYLVTGPGIEHSGRVVSAVGPLEIRFYHTWPEVVSAFTLADTFEAPAGDYRIRLFAEGPGEFLNINGAGEVFDMDWEPDRQWSVDVRVVNPIPEPATWLIAMATFATCAAVASRRAVRRCRTI